MIYLICQDWINTSNNHAGMKYLSMEITRRNPEEYKALCIPDIHHKYVTSKNRIIRKTQYLYFQYQFKKEIQKVLYSIIPQLKKDDKVILMEYMEKVCPQLDIANAIKKRHPSIQIFVLVHLVPQKLTHSFSNDEFNKWLKPVDKIITLGHSLSEYIEKRGIPKSKIITTFHYVDDFYLKQKEISITDKITVIAMGNQMRNILLLKEIVKNNPSIKFVICQGVSNMTKHFALYQNVKLIPFVPEKELRELMDMADISLNVMEDTIGSNVIVTSLAMGLAMICSDVGSIRDYCDETNTIFCNNENPAEFNKALSFLFNNPNTLIKFRKAAYNRSKSLSINCFIKELKDSI